MFKPLAVILSWTLLPIAAYAVDSLPYTQRRLPYNGLGTTVRGDIHTLGMGGATTGLADTFAAALENPAGLAMTVDSAGFKIITNQIGDGQLQNADEVINTNNAVVGTTIYPWGFSLSYVSPYTEGQPYLLNGTETVASEVHVGEFRASIARLLFNNRLSLGVSLTLSRGSRKMLFLDQGEQVESHTSYAFGMTSGLQIQLPSRWLIGAAFSLPITHSGKTGGATGVQDFFQPILIPYTASLGVGWIPNRLFRAGFSLKAIGPRTGAALLSDETKTFRGRITLSPHLGASYTFLDTREFAAHWTLGSYFEMSRVNGAPHRFHGTTGIDADLWIFSLGAAVDLARHYNNTIVGIGVDVMKIFQKLDLMPSSSEKPTHSGLFPSPFVSSDIGLPRPLVRDWKPSRKGAPNMIEAGKALPRRIEDKIRDASEDFMGTLSGEDDKPAPRPKPKAKAPAKTKKKKKSKKK